MFEVLSESTSKTGGAAISEATGDAASEVLFEALLSDGSEPHEIAAISKIDSGARAKVSLLTFARLRLVRKSRRNFSIHGVIMPLA